MCIIYFHITKGIVNIHNLKWLLNLEVILYMEVMTLDENKASGSCHRLLGKC